MRYLFLMLLAATTVVSAGVQEGVVALEKGEFKKAFQKFKQPAKNGDQAAKYYIGVLYMKGRGVQRDQNKGIKLILESANSGFALAQVMMGVMYKKGAGVKKDLNKSFAWYLKAAKNGNPYAQAFLAYGYYYGIGTTINKKQALMWAFYAKKNGNKVADELIPKLKKDLSKKEKEWVAKQVRTFPK